MADAALYEVAYDEAVRLGRRPPSHRPSKIPTMPQTNPSKDPLEPDWPSPMQGEEAVTFREAIGILTPRWLKRLFRRRRSS